MKWLVAFTVSVGMLSAQAVTGRAAGGVVFTSPGGYGNVAFPGTGRPVTGNFGRGAGLGQPQNTLRNSYRGGVGFAYPVIVGGGYYDPGSAYPGANYYGQPQQQQPNITIINNPPAAPAVIINQNFGAAQPEQPEAASAETTHIFQSAPHGATQDAAATEAPAPPRYFLIAYKDHSVYSALAYWVEDKTMHYVTPQQTHNQASLDLIDVDFTKKLNQR